MKHLDEIREFGHEQVDSVLVAVDVAALHARRHGSGTADTQRTAQPGDASITAGSRQQCASGSDAAADTQQAAAVWPTLPQVDFAPTLAALLGAPIPYASIGRVSHGLWHLRGCASNGGAESCRQRYAATLQSNAWQVHPSSALVM